MTLTENGKCGRIATGFATRNDRGSEKAILKSIQLKFGRVPEELEKLISDINDLEELDKLFTKAILANSLEELLK
jgi:hypothetical protein